MSSKDLLPSTGKAVNTMVNSLETITYYKHHYVRKTGLKKAIKQLIQDERKEARIEELKKASTQLDYSEPGEWFDARVKELESKEEA